MRRFIPFLAWLVGGTAVTLIIAFMLFMICFLARDEERGSHLGAFAGAIVIAIYIIVPVGVLGSAFVALSKLRGVIDEKEEPKKLSHL
jgi:uncharacterized membrane protein YcjF (UPF0283 family)